MNIHLHASTALNILKQASKEGVPYSLVQINPNRQEFKLQIESHDWQGPDLHITLRPDGGWTAEAVGYVSPGGNTT